MARQGLFANTMGSEAALRRAELEKERRAYLEGQIYSDPLVNTAAQANRGMRQAFRDVGQGAATAMLGDKAYQDPILKQALKRDKDRKELSAMFANADTDGDGKISEAEYKAVANAMKARGYPIEAEKVLEEMRKDIQLGLTKKADERAEKQLDISQKQLEIQQLKSEWETEDRPEKKKALAAQLRKLNAEINLLQAKAKSEGATEHKVVVASPNQVANVMAQLNTNKELKEALENKYGTGFLGVIGGGPNSDEQQAIASQILSYQKTHGTDFNTSALAVLGKKPDKPGTPRKGRPLTTKEKRAKEAAEKAAKQQKKKTDEYSNLDYFVAP